MQNNERIGELLIQQGLITEDQLAVALNKQKNSIGKVLIGHVLVDLGFVSFANLITSVAKHQRIPKAEALLQERIKLREKYAKQQTDSPLLENEPTLTSPPAESLQKTAPNKSAQRTSSIYEHTDDLSAFKKLKEKHNFELPPLPLSDLDALPRVSADENQVVVMCRDLLAAEELKDAEEFIDDAYSHFPQSSRLAWSKSWLYLRTNRQSKALKVMLNLPDLPKSLAVMQVMTAYCYLINGNFMAAIVNFTRVIKENDHPKLLWLFLLGYSHLANENYEETAHVLKQYLKLTGNIENKFVHFARIQLQQLTN